MKGRMFMNRIENISIDQINPVKMKKPRPYKLAYYEEYYLKSKIFAHGIIVDENNYIRHGYTSYLIAKKYNVEDIPVYKVDSSKRIQKILICRHVKREKDGTFRLSCKKSYQWRYIGRHPVIPGDILLNKDTKKMSLVVVMGIMIDAEKTEHKAIYKHIEERAEYLLNTDK